MPFARVHVNLCFGRVHAWKTFDWLEHLGTLYVGLGAGLNKKRVFQSAFSTTGKKKISPVIRSDHES